MVEELGSGVDMIVGSRVGPADNHDRVAGRGRGGGMVDAVVIDGRLEKMRIGLDPKQCESQP